MGDLFAPANEAAKIMLLGDSGHGKSGAKASLIAAGYKIRSLDTDNGHKLLRSLLTNPKYPYAEYIKKAGIDLTEPGRLSFIPIEAPMGLESIASKDKNGRTISWDVLAPQSSSAWNKAINLISKGWIDDGKDLGKVTDWGPDTVLDLDTLSSLAELAEFFIQDMNARLGVLADDHGRDNGDAQKLISRLMRTLSHSSILCNIICNTHVVWVDVESGAAQSPSALLREHRSVNARGFPQAIGRASAPTLAKRWNDTFVVQRRGSGENVERYIHTTSMNNIDAKNSVWLEPKYPISTGLAQIFAALRYTNLPEGFLETIGKNDKRPDQSSGETRPNGQPSPAGRASGFGARG